MIDLKKQDMHERVAVLMTLPNWELMKLMEAAFPGVHLGDPLNDTERSRKLRESNKLSMDRTYATLWIHDHEVEVGVPMLNVPVNTIMPKVRKAIVVAALFKREAYKRRLEKWRNDMNLSRQAKEARDGR